MFRTTIWRFLVFGERFSGWRFNHLHHSSFPRRRLPPSALQGGIHLRLASLFMDSENSEFRLKRSWELSSPPPPRAWRPAKAGSSLGRVRFSPCAASCSLSPHLYARRQKAAPSRHFWLRPRRAMLGLECSSSFRVFRLSFHLFVCSSVHLFIGFGLPLPFPSALDVPCWVLGVRPGFFTGPTGFCVVLCCQPGASARLGG